MDSRVLNSIYNQTALHTSRPSPLLRRSRHAPWPALFPCSSEPAFAEASGFCKNRLLQLTHASATEFKPASAGSNPPPCATPKQVWTLAATGERTGTRSADGQGAASPLHQASPPTHLYQRTLPTCRCCILQCQQPAPSCSHYAPVGHTKRPFPTQGACMPPPSLAPKAFSSHSPHLARS